MRTACSVVFVAAALVASMPASAAEDYCEGWDDGSLAGWVPNTIACTVEVVDTGGNPDGYLASHGNISGSMAIGTTTTLSEVSDDYAAADVREVSFDLVFISGFEIFIAQLDKTPGDGQPIAIRSQVGQCAGEEPFCGLKFLLLS